MAVYIDNTRNKLGRMITCHMMADTLEELHAMADRIGMRRDWFQIGSTPHYDVPLFRRKLAVAYGAIEVDRRGIVAVIRRLRAQGLADDAGDQPSSAAHSRQKGHSAYP